MRLPLQITARDLELSPNVEQLIREETGKLESFYERLTGCRVLVVPSQVELPRNEGWVLRETLVGLEPHDLAVLHTDEL